MVFDEAIWEGAGRNAPSFGGVPANPGILKGGDVLLSRPSLSLLAEAAHLPAEVLESNVAEYNHFCAGGPQIDPPRSGHPHPIEQGPFHAVRVMAGVFYTLGGVLVNGKAKVLGADEHPIEGLYAAGGTMGGLGGGPDHAYAGGWTQASTFGLLAAESSVGEGY
jgi:fumarate reductase flavoprotein subunit